MTSSRAATNLAGGSGGRAHTGAFCSGRRHVTTKQIYDKRRRTIVAGNAAAAGQESTRCGPDAAVPLPPKRSISRTCIVPFWILVCVKI